MILYPVHPFAYYCDKMENRFIYFLLFIMQNFIKKELLEKLVNNNEMVGNL